MAQAYERINQYLQHLRDRYNVQICIKDFCGFIPINKELDKALQPFLAHTNPFCMFMKSDREHYRVCLSMIRRIYHKCETERKTFFGVCHAGLGEYVIPIFDGDTLLGSINVGFFQTDEAKTMRRIRRACTSEPLLDENEAIRLYHSYISNPNIDIESMITSLEMVAEYLALTYHIIKSSHAVPNSVVRYHDSSEDNIISHSIEYIRKNIRNHISVAELAEFCHCSESYLSRVFKKRTGVNINVYINKVRLELAKNHLLLSTESIAEIADSVGFNDPNYFSRVFAKLIGIPPTEFRRRFNKTWNE